MYAMWLVRQIMLSHDSRMIWSQHSINYEKTCKLLNRKMTSYFIGGEITTVHPVFRTERCFKYYFIILLNIA